MGRRPGQPGAAHDAAAVAAVTAWREAQPPVIDDVPIEVALATFITVASMTTTALAGGVYRFTLNLLTSGTNAGALIQLGLAVDGALLFPLGPRYNFGDVTALIPFAGDLPLALAPGERLIEVWAAHPPSPGVAQVDFSSLMLEIYL